MAFIFYHTSRCEWTLKAMLVISTPLDDQHGQDEQRLHKNTKATERWLLLVKKTIFYYLSHQTGVDIVTDSYFSKLAPL